MLEDAAETFASRESGESRHPQRARHNPLPLPADADGQPRGTTCSADLVALLEHFRPKSSSRRTRSSTRTPTTTPPRRRLIWRQNCSNWQPEIALLYANHLHDNDRWPMGPAGCGIALPPAFTAARRCLWSPTLSEAVQLDKAMALAMQHDLQGRLPFKKRCAGASSKCSPVVPGRPPAKTNFSARPFAAMNCSGYVVSTPECRGRRVAFKKAHRLLFARNPLQD
jgi:hypothetical protein